MNRLVCSLVILCLVLSLLTSCVSKEKAEVNDTTAENDIVLAGYYTEPLFDNLDSGINISDYCLTNGLYLGLDSRNNNIIECNPDNSYEKIVYQCEKNSASFHGISTIYDSDDLCCVALLEYFDDEWKNCFDLVFIKNDNDFIEVPINSIIGFSPERIAVIGKYISVFSSAGKMDVLSFSVTSENEIKLKKVYDIKSLNNFVSLPFCGENYYLGILLDGERYLLREFSASGMLRKSLDITDLCRERRSLFVTKDETNQIIFGTDTGIYSTDFKTVSQYSDNLFFAEVYDHVLISNNSMSAKVYSERLGKYESAYVECTFSQYDHSKHKKLEIAYIVDNDENKAELLDSLCSWFKLKNPYVDFAIEGYNFNSKAEISRFAKNMADGETPSLLFGEDYDIESFINYCETVDVSDVLFSVVDEFKTEYFSNIINAQMRCYKGRLIAPSFSVLGMSLPDKIKLNDFYSYKDLLEQIHREKMPAAISYTADSLVADWIINNIAIEGNIGLSDDELYQMLDFVKTNHTNIVSNQEVLFHSCTINDISDYKKYADYYSTRMQLYGVPNGKKEPLIVFNVCFAICVNVDGNYGFEKEFLKWLYTPDAQEILFAFNSIPLIKNYSTQTNLSKENTISVSTINENNGISMVSPVIHEHNIKSLISDYINTLESCTQIAVRKPELYEIIYKEIERYVNGYASKESAIAAMRNAVHYCVVENG